MSNSLNPVFGEWYTDRQLGTGTDGKVFSIYRQKYDGTREKSVLKIIRLGENREEKKNLFAQDDNSVGENSEEYYSKIISTITNNVRTIMEEDGGKHFVRYENIELRKASDGKGRLILLKLEEMRSLSDLLKEFSFTLEETLRLGISVCKSLIKCRSFGDYIYPNLKPENILFDRNGICKLGDFGTFSLLEPAKTGVAYKRSQYYMAPEFIKTGNVNTTVDTYALGLVLFMLTNRNRLPFSEEYPNKVTINSLNEGVQKRSAGVPLPEPQLASPELKRIIAKACAYKPSDRYFTPEQMLSDLQNALSNKPFEEAKYNDVYSVSDGYEMPEEDVLIPDVEEIEREPEKEIEVVSLKEEIKIPDIIPVYKRKPATAKKKAVHYEKLPEIKRKKKPAKELTEKIIRMAIITVLLFIMMIASMILNADKSGGENKAIAAAISNCNYIINGGVLFNGC
ncbi:MAG: protein kinase [Clostridia bacterium]|nr:protein kinase [Clostridia bacterium]